METITAAFVRQCLPQRDPEGHKGDFGKVLCICGSVGYTGAPIFASRAAVRTGAGLVFLGVPQSVWPVAAVKSDEAMPFPLPETADGKLSLLAEAACGRAFDGLFPIVHGDYDHYRHTRVHAHRQPADNPCCCCRNAAFACGRKLYFQANLLHVPQTKRNPRGANCADR